MLLLKKADPRRQAKKALYKMRLRRGDVAIDCGANVGKVTDRLARHGATVYAFEPNPHAFKTLQNRFLGQANIHCIQKGVLDEAAAMKLYFHQNAPQDQVKYSQGSSVIESKGDIDLACYAEIDLIDLCEFISNLCTRVKVLKMDVEGAEGRILKKLISSGLVHQIDHVFVEMHDKYMPELEDELNEVRELVAEQALGWVNLDWR